MAKKRGAGGAKTTNSNRKNGKAPKQHPKTFDPAKRRLVTAK